MKVYFARPIFLFKTPQDKRDLELLSRLGFDSVNPDKEELQRRYPSEGMKVFIDAVSDCDALAFRANPDMSITSGVKKEIDKAIELGLPVFELPTILEKRVLSVEDTREYLKLVGHR